MDENSETLRWISTILMGAAGGVLLAGIILFFLNTIGFQNRSVPFLFLLLLAGGIPWCFDVVEKRGMNPLACELLLIALSFGICLLYGHVSAKTEATAAMINGTTALLHAVSLAVTGIRFVVRYYRTRKEKE